MAILPLFYQLHKIEGHVELLSGTILFIPYTVPARCLLPEYRAGLRRCMKSRSVKSRLDAT